MKYLLSTDIVLITQLLRKRLEKGKTCYQRACQLLYTYLISGSSITVEKPVQKPIKSKTFSSDFFLTNFAPTSAFRAFGHQSSVVVPLIFPEGDPKPNRRNTEQRWEEGRSWSGSAQVLKIDRSGIIKSLLCCITLVSMFSLSAQTPREDSGAEGLSQIQALQPGDKIPDAVWNQSLELNYFNGKKKTIKFSELKGKLILLDFWATTCPSCIENIPHMEAIQERYGKEVTVILVNSKRNKDTPSRIKLVLDRYKEKYNYEIKLLTILDDTVLTNLFPHNTIPNITWINQDGIFLGNTLPDEVGKKNIQTILQNKYVDLQLRGTFRNKDTAMETPPIFDTTGVKFLSTITGYLPDYLPTYPNVAHKNGKSNYQMVNAAFNFMLLNAFKNELKGFESTDYVYEEGLKDKIQQMILGGSRRQYKYSYQLFVADTISPGRAERYFQRAFKDYFHLTIERKRGPVSYYKIEILDNISDLKSKGGMHLVNVKPEEGPISFRNFPLVTLLSLLHHYVDLPVSYNRSEDMQIDLTFPVGFERMPVEEKLSFLASKGIVLTKQQREKEYPYISRIY